MFSRGNGADVAYRYYEENVCFISCAVVSLSLYHGRRASAYVAQAVQAVSGLTAILRVAATFSLF
jgi:hypothetical protein